MTEQEKKYYALLDLYEKGIQSLKENEYTIDENEYYEELTKIMTPEEEKKDEISDNN